LSDPESITADPLAALPGYVLRRAANAMMAELANRLSAIDVRLDIQRANMVPLLNRLEGAGLIERRPLDRKSQAIVLTAAGEKRLAEVRKVTNSFEDDLLARIPAAHRPHFVPALQSLLD